MGDARRDRREAKAAAVARAKELRAALKAARAARRRAIAEIAAQCRAATKTRAARIKAIREAANAEIKDLRQRERAACQAGRGLVRVQSKAAVRAAERALKAERAHVAVLARERASVARARALDTTIAALGTAQKKVARVRASVRPSVASLPPVPKLPPALDHHRWWEALPAPVRSDDDYLPGLLKDQERRSKPQRRRKYATRGVPVSHYVADPSKPVQQHRRARASKSKGPKAQPLAWYYVISGTRGGSGDHAVVESVHTSRAAAERVRRGTSRTINELYVRPTRPLHAGMTLGQAKLGGDSIAWELHKSKGYHEPVPAKKWTPPATRYED